MCGIAGVAGPSADLRLVEGMLQCLTHRGPDGEGTWADGQCALGQRRLAILDLSEAGQAPMGNEDGTVWVTFNGEIYNFQDLRDDLRAVGHAFRSDTDTEVIVHAYEQWGVHCLERFRGMFAMAVWDKKNQTLFLARDRVGKKPLFYATVGDSFYFASELQALLRTPGLGREVDRNALQYYLSFGYIPAPLTGFASIKKLLPGTWMTLDLRGEPRQRTASYWSLPYLPKAELSDEDAAGGLREVLTEAVRLRMISDVPLGAFLSGGVDSSIIVGLMAELSSTQVRTFSIGFEESDYSELHHARRVAERFGTDHQEHLVQPDALEILPMLVRHYGEPYADSSAIPTYYVSQMTRRSVTVALNGDGGDESFGGYDRYRANAAAALLGKLPGLKLAAAAARTVPSSKSLKDPFQRAERFFSVAGRTESDRYQTWMTYFTREDKARLCDPDFLQTGSTDADEWFRELFVSKNSTHPLDNAMSVDVRSYLPYDLLVKVDIASMANSLEARSPFLDHEVMEFAAKLPVRFKVRGRSGKHLLKKTFEDLLPPENVNRPKMGFGVPVGRWFRGPLKETLRDALLSQSSDRGYFKHSEVERLVIEHLEGSSDHSAKLWNLLMLEMWHREVVEGDRWRSGLGR